MEFICLFCPAFISMLIKDRKTDYFKNNSLPKIVTTYFIYNLTINTIILFITKIVFRTYSYLFTVSFSIKYIFMAVFLAIILPISIEKVKREKGIKRTLKLINKKVDIILKKHTKILLFIFLTFLFYSFDIFCRTKCYEVTEFYEVTSLSTNLMTLAYSFLISVIIIYLPKIVSKIVLCFLFIFTFAISLTNYFLLVIKQEAFSIYELSNAGEGFKFLNFLIKEINFKLVGSLLLMIVLFVVCLIIIHKTDYKRKHGWITLIIVIILFVSLRSTGIKLLGEYKPNEWNAVNKPAYYYNRFNNPKRCLNVLGLYEYMTRDMYFFIKNSSTKYDDVKKIDKEVSKRGYNLEKNKYTDIFKDKNLIMIMMESIDNVVVNKDAMPTLIKMEKEGINFTNRYGQSTDSGATIATEFTSLTSLYYTGKEYNTYKNKYTVSVPMLFAKNGYTTTFVHENKGIYYNRNALTKAIGFEKTYFLYDNLKKYNTFDDVQLAENNKVYNKIVNNQKGKFMTFITTMAAHGPFSNNYHCSLDEDASKSEYNCFKHLANNTDNFLALLLERLEEDELLDDTVIVLFTDHYAYSYGFTKEELKKTYKKITEDYKIKNLPFVIYNSATKGKQIDDILVNDVDMLPTLFNMFGIEYDPNIYIGTDLFSDYHKNLVAFNDHSWYNGEVYSFNEDVEITKEFKENNNYVNNLFNLNDRIINSDYYSHYTLKEEKK